MTGKHRVTVNLGDDEYEALQRIAAGSDRPLAWLGRRAICDYIRNAETTGEQRLSGSTEVSGQLSQ